MEIVEINAIKDLTWTYWWKLLLREVEEAIADLDRKIISSDDNELTLKKERKAYKALLTLPYDLIQLNQDPEEITID